jgi:hypothetical protein
MCRNKHLFDQVSRILDNQELSIVSIALTMQTVCPVKIIGHFFYFLLK